MHGPATRSAGLAVAACAARANAGANAGTGNALDGASTDGAQQRERQSRAATHGQAMFGTRSLKVVHGALWADLSQVGTAPNPRTGETSAGRGTNADLGQVGLRRTSRPTKDKSAYEGQVAFEGRIG